jgi:elongation factor Ts
MAAITAELVRQLREATNVSMMECKRALVEAGGDMAKATRLLRERGMAVAAKKASRATNQGLLASATADNGRAASLIEVNCETDFVARNETFKAFVQELAKLACTTDALVAELAKERVAAKIAEIGENIVVRRNVRFRLQGPGTLGSYIHLGGKVGVLIEVGAGTDAAAATETFQDLVRDLKLHVAACSPRYLTPAEIPAAEITTEREIYAKQVHGKPPQIVDKIVDGKLKKYYAEVCLLEQGFVKEPKQSVSALLAEKGKALGEQLTVRRFLRYQLGE